MANSEAVRILSKGSALLWNRYRKESSPEFLDLSGVDFSNHLHRYADYDFSGVNFSGCKLHNINFEKTNLENAIFEKASVSSANFVGTKLNNANFNEAIFRDTTLQNCLAENSSFNKIKANNTDFSGAKLSNSNFKGSELNGTKFNNCQLANTNFENTALSTVSFENAQIGSTDQKSSSSTFKKASLTKCNFQNTKILDVSFEHTEFNDTYIRPDYTKNNNFSYSVFNVGGIQHSKLVDCTFFKSKFINSQYYQSHFQNCNFEGSEFYDCNISKVSFEDSNFWKVKSFSTEFEQNKWRYVKIDKDTLFENPITIKENVMVDKSDEVKIKFPDNLINWSNIRWIGQIPLFGFSWVSLLFSISAINAAYFLNHNRFFKIFEYPIVIPERIKMLLIGSLFLAISITFYKIFCPKRIQVFSENEWVEEHQHFRFLYFQESLKKPAWRCFVWVTLIIGGFISLSLIVEHLYYSWLYLNDSAMIAPENEFILDKKLQ